MNMQVELPRELVQWLDDNYPNKSRPAAIKHLIKQAMTKTNNDNSNERGNNDRDQQQ